MTSQWAQCVLNNRSLDCLLNRLLRCRSKKTSKLRVAGLSYGNPPVIGGLPSQRIRNAENVSIWWRHHECRSDKYDERRFWWKKCMIFALSCYTFQRNTSYNSHYYIAPRLVFPVYIHLSHPLGNVQFHNLLRYKVICRHRVLYGHWSNRMIHRAWVERCTCWVQNI